ncbi:hypothetical protein A2U01_0076461, partial [Trifolium medium]|nr:hypothetical protein [Trifolium medium]
AKVARFDRFEANEGGRGGKNLGGVKEGEEDLVRRTENLNAQGLNVRKGVDETIARAVPKAKERDEPLLNSVSRSADFAEEVRVGEVLVKLGDRQ